MCCCCCSSVPTSVPFPRSCHEGFTITAPLLLSQNAVFAYLLEIWQNCQQVATHRCPSSLHTHMYVFIRLSRAHRIHAQLPQEHKGCLFGVLSLSVCSCLAVKKKSSRECQASRLPIQVCSQCQQQHTQPALAWCINVGQFLPKGMWMVLWKKVSGSNSETHEENTNVYTVSASC